MEYQSWLCGRDRPWRFNQAALWARSSARARRGCLHPSQASYPAGTGSPGGKGVRTETLFHLHSPLKKGLLNWNFIFWTVGMDGSSFYFFVLNKTWLFRRFVRKHFSKQALCDVTKATLVFHPQFYFWRILFSEDVLSFFAEIIIWFFPTSIQDLNKTK